MLYALQSTRVKPLYRQTQEDILRDLDLFIEEATAERVERMRDPRQITNPPDKEHEEDTDADQIP